MVRIRKFRIIVIVSNWTEYWSNYSIQFEISNIRTALLVTNNFVIHPFAISTHKPRRFFPYAAGEGPASVGARSSVCWHFLFCSIISSSRDGSSRTSWRSSRTSTRGKPKNGNETRKKSPPMNRKPAHQAPTQRGLLDVSLRSTVLKDSRST